MKTTMGFERMRSAMKKKVSLRTCLLLCVICIFSTITVFGNTTMQEIIAYLNYSIDIVVDGEVKELKDAQGNRVYPISYNGTTYVPIRAVSTLVGVDVKWDSVHGNVVLTTRDKTGDKGVNLLENVSKVTTYSYVLTPETEKNTRFAKEDSVFENGLYCTLLSNQDFQGKDFVPISLSDDITKISFEGYAGKRCSINVFNQQGRLLKTFYLQADKLTDFEFEINAAENNKIYFVAINQSYDDSGNNANNYVRILNVFGK